MPKIITIDRCIECRHCAFNSQFNNDVGYFCINGKMRGLDDVETIPEWCELEEATDAQRCVWTGGGKFFATSCGKKIMMSTDYARYDIDYMPEYCFGCGRRIEVLSNPKETR